MEVACENSANLEQETKTTKIVTYPLFPLASSNGVMAAMQCYLCQDGIDEFSGENVHNNGSSPANQRIEGWWSFFRRGRAGW